MPTVISGTTLNALTTVSWGVMSLFANNEQGVWFDPSDLNNYMSGLGPELITNSTFNSNITGWTTHNSPTTSIDSQRVKIIGTGGSSGIYQDVTLDASKSYEIKGLITTDAASTQTCSITLREGGAGTFSSISGYSDVSAAAGTSANARWVLSGRSVVRIFLVAGYAASGGIAYFDNISVKELTTISSATMFQDSAGTIPVTAVEQPVGLILDKSKGLALGSELVTNGDFSGGTTGWSPANANITIAVVGGVGEMTSSAANIYVAQTVNVTSGKTYIVTGQGRAGTAPLLPLVVSGGVVLGTQINSSASLQPISFIFVAGAATASLRFQVQSGSGGTAYFDNISVKEIAGNHASQSTAASRPVLSARHNLLTRTEDFDNVTSWARIGSNPITANHTTAPNGTNTADLFTAQANGPYTNYLYQTGIVLGATSYKVSIRAKKGTQKYIFIDLYSPSIDIGAVFDLDAGTYVGSAGLTAYDSTPTITPIGNGWYEIVATKTVAANTYSFAVSTATGNNATQATGDTIYIWGADLRVTNVGTNLPPYQRVGAAVTATTNPAVTGVPDYDTNGFPLYLKFDGVDDSLATASIDFSVTDKMSVFAGVRKLSDAQQGFIAHIGDGGANDFMLQNYTDASFYWGAGGSSFVQINSPNISSPATRVLTGLSNISADSLIFRVNGSSSATSSSDQGTGQFSNSTLKVGSIDGGLSKHYNGHLYNLIIRGALSNSVDIINTEAYINSKTKAY